MITINLSILVFLIILYIILNLFYNKHEFNPGKDTESFLLNIHKYYISNICYVYFTIIIYFILNTLIFMLFRIQYLGISNIVDFSINSLGITNILNILIFMLNIILYFQILPVIFYSYLIQLHFYLYQKPWYNSLNNFIRDNDMKLSDICRECAVYCKKRLLHNMFIKKHKNLIEIVEKCSHFFIVLAKHISRFFYYLPYTVLALIFIYDLFNGYIYYTYFMLFILLFITRSRKYRRFLYVKDPVYDSQISDYFYKDKNKYLFLIKNIKKISEKSLINFEDLGNVLSQKDEIIEYFKKDFHVYYILYKDRIEAEKLLSAKAKRLNLLLLSFLGFIFVLYNLDKYQIFILNIYKLNLLVTMPLTIIIYVCNRKILYKDPQNEVLKNNKIYYILFHFFIFIQAIILFIIILKNKITSIPSETIIDFYYFKIIEIYTVEDKENYLKHYLNILENYKIIDEKESWISIKETIKITQETTLENIRDAVKDYIIKSTKEPQQGHISFIQKIIAWIYKK